jgi:hypothetical protein
MQTTSSIRRYVLLRHRGHGPAGSRWSIEQVALAPRDAAHVVADAQRAKPASSRD